MFSGKLFPRCYDCQEQYRWERMTQADRVKNGFCKKCHIRPRINPNTGRPKHLCHKHQHEEWERRYRKIGFDKEEQLTAEYWTIWQQEAAEDWIRYEEEEYQKRASACNS